VAAAILDRLLHHSSVVSIEGESYRMRGRRDKISRLRPTADVVMEAHPQKLDVETGLPEDQVE